MRECVRVCVRACVRSCVRSCVRACVRVCVRACVRALTYGDQIYENSDSAILLHIYLLGKFRTNDLARVSR